MLAKDFPYRGRTSVYIIVMEILGYYKLCATGEATQSAKISKERAVLARYRQIGDDSFSNIVRGMGVGYPTLAF